MSFKDERAAAVKAAEDITSAVRAAGREMTDEEAAQVEAHIKTVNELDAKAHRAEKSAGLLRQLGELSAGGEQAIDEQPGDAKNLGEYFVKSPAFGEMGLKRGGRFSVSAPEFKAAGDPLVTTGLTQTQYGDIVPLPLRRPTVASLLGSGTMTATSLTYWVQGAMQGDFATVAENALKPGMTFGFTPLTENLSKIAGWHKFSDEMMEDADYVMSVINSQLLLRLALAEEAQLLNGNGTPPNLRGILNRVGVQTETPADTSQNLDAIFRAMTKVQTATELTADAVVINPTDYQTFRLSRDGNEQYYGGGPFTGAYGNDGLQQQPGLWGQQTVVTSAIAAGTVLVGAFAASGQVFRKGGVRVESTNSDADDFKYNRVTVRAEERLALAVYMPSAFVKVTLSSTPPA